MDEEGKGRGGKEGKRREEGKRRVRKREIEGKEGRARSSSSIYVDSCRIFVGGGVP